MLSPGRLFATAFFAACVYGLFFAVPAGPRAEGQFDPERLAALEIDVRKAARGHEQFGVYIALVPMLREQYRYSWFRAGQAAYPLARATTAFVDMRARYERVLPDLEDAAAIERDWMSSTFTPSAVARAELDWWVTRRLPNLSGADQVAPMIAQEYALRYQVPVGAMMDAAERRAHAEDLIDQGGVDPNWAVVTTALAESYQALHRALNRPRTRAVPE